MAVNKSKPSPVASLLNQSLLVTEQAMKPQSAVANMLRETQIATEAAYAPAPQDMQLGYTLGETFGAAAEAGAQQLEGDVKRFGAIYNLIKGDEEQAQKRLNQAEVLSQTSGKILGDLGEFSAFVEEPTVEGFFEQVIKGIGQFTPMAVSSIASGFAGGAVATIGKGVLSSASKKVTNDMMASIVKKHALHKAGKGAALNVNEKAILDAAYETAKKSGQYVNYLNVARAGQAANLGRPAAVQAIDNFPAANVGFWAGAFGQEYVVGSSQALAEYDEAGYKLTKEEAKAALGLGIPQAVLGTLGEKLFVGALFKRAAKDFVKTGDKKFGNYMKEMARGLGGGLLQGGTQEGLTELGQEELLIRQRMAIDPEYSSQDANLRRAESAFVGFWAGGARSAPTSAIANVIGLARSNVEGVNDIVEAIKSGKVTAASKLPKEALADLTAQTRDVLTSDKPKKGTWIPFEGSETAADKAGYFIAILNNLKKQGVIDDKTAAKLDFVVDPDGAGLFIYDRSNPQSVAVKDDYLANGFSEEQLRKNQGYTYGQDASQTDAVVVRDKDGNEIHAESIPNEEALKPKEEQSVLAKLEQEYAKQIAEEGYTVKQEVKEDVVNTRNKKIEAEVRGFEGEENIDPETGEIVDDEAFGSDIEMYGQEVTIQDAPDDSQTTVTERLKSAERPGRERQAAQRRRREQKAAMSFPQGASSTTIAAIKNPKEQAAARRARINLEEDFYDIIGPEERTTWVSKTIEEFGMATTGRINSVPNEALQAFIKESKDNPTEVYSLELNENNEWGIIKQRTAESETISVQAELPNIVQKAIQSPIFRIGNRRKIALENRWSVKKPGEDTKYQAVDISFLIDFAMQVNQERRGLTTEYTLEAGYVADAFDTALDLLAEQGYKIHFAGKPLNQSDGWVNTPLYKHGKKNVSYSQAISNRGEKLEPSRLSKWQAEALNKAGMDIKEGDPVPTSLELRELLETVPQQVVDGGTGWAVQMALDMGKPVYVFDGGKWYGVEDGKFVETKRPDLTKDHAIIGTRKAQPKVVSSIERDAQGTIKEQQGKPVIVNEAFNKQIRNQIAALYRGTDESYTNHSGGAIGVDMIGKELGEKKGVKQNHYYVEGKGKPKGANVAISQQEANKANPAIEKANETLNRDISKASENVKALYQRNFWQADNAEAVYAFASLIDNPVYSTISRILDQGLADRMEIDTPKTQAEINLEERGILYTKLKIDPETSSVMMENANGVLETVSNVNLRTADEKRSKNQLGSPTVLGGTAKESRAEASKVDVDSSVEAVLKGALPVLRSIVNQFFGERNLRVLDINNVLNNPNAFVKTKTKTKTTKKTTKAKTTKKPGKVEQRNIPNTEIYRTKTGARRTTIGVYTEDKVTVSPAAEKTVVEQETIRTPIEGYEAVFSFEGKNMKVSDILKLLAHKMKTEGGKGKWVKFGDTEVILLNIPETNPETGLKATPAQLGEVVLTLAHELGHSVYNQTLNNMLTHKNMREKLQKAFEADKKRVGTAAYEGKYGFEEWFSDQMGAWITREMTKEGASANNVVDSFFKRLAKKIIGVFKQLDQMLQKRFTINMDFDAYVSELSEAILSSEPSVSVTQEIEIRNMVDDVASGVHDNYMPKSLRTRIKNKAVQTLKTMGELLPTDRRHWGVEYLILPAHNVLKRALVRSGLDPAFADMIYSPSQSKAATGTLNGRISLMYMRLNELGKLAPQKKNGEPDIDAWEGTLKQAEDDTLEYGQLSPEAKKVRRFLEDFFKDNIEGKDALIKFRKNFYPRIINMEALLDNGNGERAALAAVIVKYNKIPLKAAEAHVEKMLQENKRNPDDPQDTVSEVSLGMAKERSEIFTKIPNKDLRDIGVLQDPYVALVTYVQDMTKRIDYKERVTVKVTQADINNAKKLAKETRQKNINLKEGEKLDNPLGFLLKPNVEVGQEFNGWQASEIHLNRISDPREQAKARNAVRSMLGVVGGIKSKPLRQLNNFMLAFNVVTMLTFAALASLPDLGGTVLRSKDFGAIKTFGKQMRKYFNNREQAQAFARDIGVVSFDSLNTMYLNAAELGFMGDWSKFATEKFFVATGLEAYTKFTRVFAAGMGEQFLVTKAADNSDIATRHLEELQITREDINKWVKNGRSFETAEGEKVRAAIARFVDESIMRPNSAERPGWASSPHFAIVWQLKSFFYAYGKNIIGGTLREANNRYSEDGKLTSAAIPLMLGATALLPLTMLGLEIRELIKYFGRGMDPAVFRSDNMEWSQYTAEIIDRSGALGAFGLIIPMLDAGKYGGQWWVPPLGPSAERVEKLMNGKFRGKDFLPFYDLGAGELLGV